MGLIGGVLNLASSIVSAATHGGGGSSPPPEVKGDDDKAEVDLGPVEVSVDDKGLSVKVDGKEVAKLDKSKLEGGGEDEAPAPPKLDLHSADTFEAPRTTPPLVANLFDQKSGIGSKPGGTGEGRA